MTQTNHNNPVKNLPARSEPGALCVRGSQLRQYTVVITNISKQPLRGYSFEFSGYRGGTHFQNDTANQRMFEPGSSATEYASAALRAVLHPGRAQLPFTLADILKNMATYPPIAKINWVVDQTGRMIGPDPNNSLADMVKAHAARQQLAARLQMATDPKALLDQLRNTPPTPGDDGGTRQTRLDARMLWDQLSHPVPAPYNFDSVANFIARVQREMPIHK